MSRKVSDILLKRGLKPVVVRHPMPFNDFSAPVQRFEDAEDLDRYHVTVDEREEYEGHLNRNLVVFTGVDYKAILAEAEKEGDVIIWDGGNNDWSFYKPDINLVVVDPLRQGHESEVLPRRDERPDGRHHRGQQGERGPKGGRGEDGAIVRQTQP